MKKIQIYLYLFQIIFIIYLKFDYNMEIKYISNLFLKIL